MAAWRFAVLCLLTLIYSSASFAQDLAEDWELTTVVFGQNLGERMNLSLDKGQFSGYVYRGEKVALKGSLAGTTFKIEFKESDGTTNTYTGQLAGGAMTGDYVSVDPSGEKTTGAWFARRPITRPPTSQAREFVPTTFYRQFSASIDPVLRIFPGDTVHTSSVDAGGTDEHSVERVLGGNPVTGPFYVEGAMPGDVLAITLKRLRLNRDWALSDKGLVERATTPDYRADNKPDWSSTRWHLDLEKGVASLEKPPDRLKNLAIPVRPMLGCVGVAPGFGGMPISTQDSGYFGGNMDVNLVGEGSTLYLSVNQPGALLYVGDGHALQGDGELNGNALETSMDITFSVDVIRESDIDMPRIENADYLMVAGFAGSLDSAFQRATSQLASWIQKDYKLSGPEAAALLGTSIQYNVAEVADRNVGVVAKMSKKVLAELGK